jgi:hypothetical protein
VTVGLAAPAPGARGEENAAGPDAGKPGAGNLGTVNSGAGASHAGDSGVGPPPTGKPTPAGLGIDPDMLTWDRSGDGEGSIEVAFPVSPRWTRGDWVLLRVAGDPAGRILVFGRNEWDCFLDGARKGEFDDAAAGEPGDVSEPGQSGGPRC